MKDEDPEETQRKIDEEKERKLKEYKAQDKKKIEKTQDKVKDKYLNNSPPKFGTKSDFYNKPDNNNNK